MSPKNDSSLNIFKLLRIMRNKTTRQLAEELEITPAYISAIESGARFPSKRLLRDYAAALGVQPETLQAYDPDNKGNEKFNQLMLHLLNIITKIVPDDDAPHL